MQNENFPFDLHGLSVHTERLVCFRLRARLLRCFAAGVMLTRHPQMGTVELPKFTIDNVFAFNCLSFYVSGCKRR
jgi:hypothetical protein